MSKIFIGGISYDTTERDLKSYFSQFGRISYSTIVYDLNTGISKGYGFIFVQDEESVEEIIKKGKHLINGRLVDANRAKGKDFQTVQDAILKEKRRLFVGGISTQTTEDDLYEYFSTFGKVLNTFIIRDPFTRASKGFGYVEYERIEDAEWVLSYNGHFLHGRKISVDYRKSKEGSNHYMKKFTKPESDITQYKYIQEEKKQVSPLPNSNRFYHSTYYSNQNQDLERGNKDQRQCYQPNIDWKKKDYNAMGRQNDWLHETYPISTNLEEIGNNEIYGTQKIVSSTYDSINRISSKIFYNHLAKVQSKIKNNNKDFSNKKYDYKYTVEGEESKNKRCMRIDAYINRLHKRQ